MKLNLYFGLVLLALVTLGACTNTVPNNEELLKRKWEIGTLKVSDSSQNISASKDYFLFTKVNNSNYFEQVFTSTGIDKTGSWILKGDSLLLTYNPDPVELGVDSVAYKVTNGKSSILYYKNGQLLAENKDNLLATPQLTETYKIDTISEEKLVIVNRSSTLQLIYDNSIDSGSFNLSNILNGLMGMVGLLLILVLLSENRRKIDWKLVASGLTLQMIFAVLVLRVPAVRSFFDICAGFFVTVLDFTRAGSEFMFGGLVNASSSVGYIFAFQVLPTILFFAALTSLLYYWGILQRIVYAFAWIMSKTMNLSGAESMSAAANIFIGQTEAPLLIKPYLEKMTRSELLAIMTGGMATIAGGVMAAYVGFLGGDDPVQRQLFASHLLAASIMSAPAALVAAKILLPQTEKFNTELSVNREKLGSNALEAIANGTTDGLKLAVNVGAMLIVFTALMAMLNYIFINGFGQIGGLNEYIKTSSNGVYDGFSLQFILGKVFSPLAWLLGVRGNDIALVGQLLGEKTILNEFFAYVTLGSMKAGTLFESSKSVVIAVYALCGFANFASIGIQIGGIGAIAPNKRSELSRLGIKALIAGTAASLFTACIAGALL